MNKHILVRSCNQSLLSNDLDESQIHDPKWKEAYIKAYVPCGSVHIMIREKQNYRGRIRPVDPRGWGRLLWGRFKIMKMFYIWTVVVITQLYTVFKMYITVCKFYLHKLTLIKTERKHPTLLNHTQNNWMFILFLIFYSAKHSSHRYLRANHFCFSRDLYHFCRLYSQKLYCKSGERGVKG